MQTLLPTPLKPVTELSRAVAFPRLQPAMARALSHLYSRSGPINFDLLGQAHSLHWCLPSGVPAEHAPYRFKLGTHVGHVGIDVQAVAVLLGERRSELLPRELRYLLWADALHALADEVEKATKLRFEWAPDAPPPPLDQGTDDASLVAPNAPKLVTPPLDRGSRDVVRAAFFTVRPHMGGFSWSGFVQFEDSGALESLLPAVPRRLDEPSSALDGLRLPLPFLLGSTPITLREVAEIGRGDIISIEDWSASGAALQVTARLGGASGCELAGLAEGSRITIHQLRNYAMNREPAAAAGAPNDGDAGQGPLDRLDSLEVHLRFEVGDLSLSLGELKDIRAGHVFELAKPLDRSPVRILAHGNVLGKGYLVAVGDRLGVRVSDFAPSEI